METAERYIHGKLRELAEEVSNKYNITIENVFFSWYNVMGGTNVLVDLRVETKSRQ
jgi:hypothetical protein